jgi:predicted acyl esterase
MRRLSVFVLLLLVPRAEAAVVSAVFGGKVACVPKDGVQFCDGGLTTRVESFDGVPLDVAVTIPPADRSGPFPLIVELHGWAGAKSDGPFVTEATAGYVVLSYTARGFGGSCGTAAARAPDATLADPNACANRGWVRLADARYEGHDSQHLAGLLVDEGLVLPDRVAVTGISYGGGQTLILAALHDRVMMPDGSLVPWKSPGGTPMTIAAAAPIIGWTDLAEALEPAGRTLDYRTTNVYGPRIGVEKQSWVRLLYSLGIGAGFYAPAGADPDADLTGWNARIEQGEPYDAQPDAAHITGEVTSHHSAYYIDDTSAPAPLFVYNSFVDDLFPADETLRYYRKVRADHPEAEIALHYEAGFGHPRAALGASLARVNAAVTAFFGRHLLGTNDPPAPHVETFTQACGTTMESGPFTAADWDALRPGEVRLKSGGTRRVRAGRGDAAFAKLEDPVVGPPCRTTKAKRDRGAATFEFPRVRGNGFTLMGSPTIVAELTVSGKFAQLVGRLWDVGPDGMETLVTHAIYRPRTDNANPQPFQLHPNGWRFAARHRLKLELVGGSPPYGRHATGDWSVRVRGLELRLPVVEAPGGKIVKTPAPPVLPPAGIEPPDA